MGTGTRRSLAAVYLLVQAVLGLVWWASLARAPDLRARFELDPTMRRTLDAFLLADLVIFVGGSALGAAAVWKRWPQADAIVAFTAGGTAYATLYLVAWVLFGGAGSVGVAPMVAATVLTTAIAVDVHRTRELA